MKTLAKSLFLTLAVAATTAMAADYTSKLVNFSSTGDTYSDGTPVLDGERYALCWSANETFGGMNAACEPLASGDEVLRVVALAKDGKCPPVVFVLDGDKAKTTGNFFVFVLDTRVSATKLSATDATTGLPATVNGTLAAATSTPTAGASSGAFDVDTSTVSFSADGVVTEPASISAIDPATATVTVANLSPVVKYNVKYGKTITDLKSAETTLGSKFSGFASEVTFSFEDKEDAKFFQLIAE